MKATLSVFLMVTILFGGGYWYHRVLAVCPVPISYRVGNIDERFAITEAELRTAISSAESLWEDGTDRNLFTYDPKGTLVVHLVYDERQAATEAEERFREVLERKEGVSDNLKSEYERLVTEYDAIRVAYNKEAQTYESKLTAYNREVADWNTRGGAPKDVFDRLETTQATLEREEDRLNGLSTQLNALVRRINNLGSQGNTLVTDYNSLVTEYNERFGEGDEFTQGEYENSVITIYEFSNEKELTVVLAHEMGHALGIDHVGGETSFMYHQMGAQDLEVGLTEYDRTAFQVACGTTNSIEKTLRYLKETLETMLRSF